MLIELLEGVRIDTQTNIQDRGFATVPGATFRWKAELQKPWEIFCQAWDDLPLDMYLKDHKTYRRRRYGRFSFTPSSQHIEPLSHISFIQQSKEVRAMYGNASREFAPLQEDLYTNSFLLWLIQFDFALFPVSVTLKQKRWTVGIHMIRINSSQEEVGLPTPEGMHHDGHAFIGMHLIQRTNVKGGLSIIYDNTGNVLQNVLLTDPLDTIYVEDKRVMHAVTPITPLNEQTSATRDLLIVTYDYPQL